MINLPVLTTFLGWCALINIGMLSFATIMLIIFNKPIKSLHCSMFRASPETLDQVYLNFMGGYKLLIFIFNLIPYCVLKLMA